MEWCSEHGGPQPDVCHDRITALETQLAEAKAVLREVEWAIYDDAGGRETRQCPVCYRWQEHGRHGPDCRLAKLLGGAP
jgi:hypothetical protein